MAGGQKEAESLGGRETESMWGTGMSSQFRTQPLTKVDKSYAADEGGLRLFAAAAWLDTEGLLKQSSSAETSSQLEHFLSALYRELILTAGKGNNVKKSHW